MILGITKMRLFTINLCKDIVCQNRNRMSKINEFRLILILHYIISHFPICIKKLSHQLK